MVRYRYDEKATHIKKTTLTKTKKDPPSPALDRIWRRGGDHDLYHCLWIFTLMETRTYSISQCSGCAYLTSMSGVGK